MSGEIVTIIASAAAILFALAGGFGWIIVRMDAGFDRLSARIDDVHLQSVERDLGLEQRLVARIDGVARSLEERLGARIDGVEQRLGARIDGVERRIDGVERRIDGVERRLGAVEVAVARLEGPPPRLVLRR